MPSIAIPVSLRGQLLNSVRAVTAFSPSTLFALNEPGVWYDPSDLTTLFQDTAGTTPVTTPGQTVALALDKSKGAVGTNGGGRKNLLIRTEEFNDAAWTKSEATVTANSGAAPDGTNTADKLIPTVTNASHYARQVSTVTNTTHTYTAYAKADGYNFVTLQLANSGTYGKYFEGVFNLSTGAVEATGRSVTYTGSRSITALASGWYRCQITVNNIDANSTTISVVLPQATNDPTVTYSGNGTSGILIWGAQLEVNSVATSYQRITSDWPATMPGFHATQATLASRPTYGIVPLGGRRNLLTRTEEFENAYWTKTAVTVSVNTSATTDPVGSNTADVVSETTNTAFHFVELQTAISFAATQYTFTAYLKQGTQRYAGIHISDGTARGCSIDLQTGTLGTPYGSATASRVVLANGWYRLTVTATVSATASGQVAIYMSNSNSLASYAGNTANNIYIWGAQLETGSSATAYQRVGSAFDVTEAGVASLSYLSFDGVDDFLTTPTITPGIDKAQVFAGVRKLSDAAVGVIAELGTNAGAGSGEFGLYGAFPANGYTFRSRGTSTVDAASPTTFPSPITNVVTGLGDISGDRSTLRINGTQVAQSTSDQGSGNYTALALYIGRRGGASLPFNGQLYSLIVRFGTNLDAGTITSTETWVNGKTGAYT